MIFAQIPTRRGDRQTPTDQTTGLPTDREFLLTSEMIANRVAEVYLSALEVGRIEAVRMADGKIRREQRFYDVEYRQAAELLEAMIPNDVDANTWLVFLRNNMGYRLVDIPFCRFGEEVDPISRECVTAAPERKPQVRRETAPPESELSPQPKPDSEGESQQKSDLMLPLAIGGGLLVVLAMLGGRK